MDNYLSNENFALKSLLVMFVGDRIIDSFRPEPELLLMEDQRELKGNVKNIIKNCADIINDELPPIPHFMRVTSHFYGRAKEITNNYMSSFLSHIDEISKFNMSNGKFGTVEEAIGIVKGEFDCALYSTLKASEDCFADDDLYSESTLSIVFLIEKTMDCSFRTIPTEEILSVLSGYLMYGKDLGGDLQAIYRQVWDQYISCLNESIELFSDFETMHEIDSSIEDVYYSDDDDDRKFKDIIVHLKGVRSSIRGLMEGLKEIRANAIEEACSFHSPSYD